jgi:two-component system, cell cycle response regulator
MGRSHPASGATERSFPAVSARSDSGAPMFTEFDDEPKTDVSRTTDFGTPPPGPALRDRPILLRLDGPHAGQVASLDSDKLTIGRHASNGVVVDDTSISRKHVSLERTPTGYLLVDLDSRNGTFVQGQRVAKISLSDGDSIQLGPRVSFRFVVADERHEQLLRQLYEASTRDALTKVFNRKHFDERLRIEASFAERHRSELSLILFDIDFFKKVNDTHGHPAGDAVLRQVARVVQHRLRVEDVLARFGGEEFAVILRGTSLIGGQRLAERLRSSVESVPAVVEHAPVPVTISLGVASLGCTERKTPEEMVVIADRRLYAAKHAGRNRSVAEG